LARLRKRRLPYAKGGVIGSSPLWNVAEHVGNRYFFTLDLASAFENIRADRLVEVVEDLIDEPLLVGSYGFAEFLKHYCLTDKGGLITGAPSSSDLFNLYTGVLIDEPLGMLAKKHRLTYSRYIDDLTFSSLEPIGRRKREQIRDVVSSAGFEISHRKAKVLDLTKGPVCINGIGLRENGTIFTPRFAVARLRALLHRDKTVGDVNHHVIYGYWGAYLPVATMGHRGRVDEKLLQEYFAFRERHGKRPLAGLRLQRGLNLSRKIWSNTLWRGITQQGLGVDAHK